MNMIPEYSAHTSGQQIQLSVPLDTFIEDKKHVLYAVLRT